jgi:hypothetical protein
MRTIEIRTSVERHQFHSFCPCRKNKIRCEPTRTTMALASDKIIGYICGVKKYKSQDSGVKEFTIFIQQVINHD